MTDGTVLFLSESHNSCAQELADDRVIHALCARVEMRLALLCRLVLFQVIHSIQTLFMVIRLWCNENALVKRGGEESVPYITTCVLNFPATKFSIC